MVIILIPFMIVLIALLCLLLLWIFLICPGRGGKRLPSRVRYYAHRGLYSGSECPENSLPAFRLATEAGYGIELDVQISSDGVAMVFHDDTLLRVCGISGGVADYTAEQLSKLSLLGNAEVGGVPTFAQVLETVGGRVPLIVEVKASLPEWKQTLAQTLKCLDTYNGPFVIESFNPMVLRELRRHRPEIIRGQLCAFYSEGRKKIGLRLFFAQWFLTNCFARPDFIAYYYGQKEKIPFSMMRLLFPSCIYVAWTPDSAEAEEKHCDGFDIIIFEHYLPKQTDIFVADAAEKRKR